MRRKKPLGWPRYMNEKRLSSGATAYYWSPPGRHLKECPIKPEALGGDYAKAKARCDETLNPLYDAWRMGQQVPLSTGPDVGTFDWLVDQYQKSPKYKALSPKAQRDYDKGLALLQNHVMKTGRRFGSVMVTSITPAVTDRLYEKLQVNEKGVPRLSTANAAMRYARRAWKVVYREHPKIVPEANPFSRMDLKAPKGGGNRAATREHLETFAAKADALGWPGIAAAAYIAFEWLQREVDIIERLSWTQYRPSDMPDAVQIKHHKTGELYWLPLEAWDGDENVQLYPELEARLAELPKRGSLIVMRDRKDARKGMHLPWNEHTFRHQVREIMDEAGLPKNLSFTSFRHGGITECGDEELTDSQTMSLSGHLTVQTMHTYNKRNQRKRERAALKRLKGRKASAARRTKGARESE